MNDKNNKKVPLFRFSEEIQILIKIIYDELKQSNVKIIDRKKDNKDPNKKITDELITRQLMRLIFKNIFRKFIENFEIYLFPYLKSAKNNVSLSESLRN